MVRNWKVRLPLQPRGTRTGKVATALLQILEQKKNKQSKTLFGTPHDRLRQQLVGDVS